MAINRSALFLRKNTSRPASYWRGVRSSDVPLTAILTESGDPILTEDGQYILTES